MRVLYFGPLKDLTGVAEDSLDATTAAEVLQRVAEKYPECAGLLESCAVSVDLEYVDKDTPIKPTSEVALIPPVSAG